MNTDEVKPVAPDNLRWRRIRAWAVHLLTASGVVIAFFALVEIAAPNVDPRWVLFWFGLATVLDGLDGPLARRWDVKRYAPGIIGRTLDDIVDYLTFTFLPLFFIWRMGWVPGAPEAFAGLWVLPAMIASLLAFAKTDAKQEESGFFTGFPSYWNLVAYFAGLVFVAFGPWANVFLILLLTVLTLAPVRFLYPTHIPGVWRWLVLGGAALWLVLAVWTLPGYPTLSDTAILGLLAGVVFYIALSVFLDRRQRRAIQ